MRPLGHSTRWLALICLVAGACSLKAKNVKPAAPYDFAQLQKMATFAQAAYSDDAAIRLLCAPSFDEVSIKVIPATNNKYFLATQHATRVQLISIAGTANIENVLVDVDQTVEMDVGLTLSLHRGFARAARLVYEDLKPQLRTGYRVQITGHSLGGAEALILGMILTSEGTPLDSIVTFGQPKVTDQAGTLVFKDLPLTRVVNEDDIIPALPLEPYRHIGPELVLFPGATYSVVEERPFKPQELVAAWHALRNHQAPAQMPQHYIANYLADLAPKVASSQAIPYPDTLTVH